MLMADGVENVQDCRLSMMNKRDKTENRAGRNDDGYTAVEVSGLITC